MKLSDFGLAREGPEGDQTHVSTRVMGTHGYAAPEYVMTGKLQIILLFHFVLLLACVVLVKKMHLSGLVSRQYSGAVSKYYSLKIS